MESNNSIEELIVTFILGNGIRGRMNFGCWMLGFTRVTLINPTSLSLRGFLTLGKKWRS